MGYAIVSGCNVSSPGPVYSIGNYFTTKPEEMIMLKVAYGDAIMIP